MPGRRRDFRQLDLFEAAGLEPTYLEYQGAVASHPLYKRWSAMKSRCLNPRFADFPNYGGRGIMICERWRKSSRAFISWAITHGWEPGLQLDRIDNDGDYCPENCHFVNGQANCRNRRNTWRLTDGRAVCEVAALAGVSQNVVDQRRFRGWSVEDQVMPMWHRVRRK